MAWRIFFRNNKTLILSIGFLTIFSFTVAKATPPTSSYSAGSTLDPQCVPGSTNCTVSVGVSPWDIVTGGINYAGGRVGVGTSTPATALDLESDGAILAVGAVGLGVTVPDLGASARLEWIPSASAFRAGTAVGTEWDSAHVGNYSAAFGVANTASGQFSFAAGANNSVTANGTGVFGTNNTVSNQFSFAAGAGNTISGDFSIAFGDSTTASGNTSMVFGVNSVAGGDFSTAFGSNNTASGNYSNALGNDNQVTGEWATAIGDSNVASGDDSFAIGFNATASNNGAMALGSNATASGSAAIAVGSQSTASGSSSFAGSLGHAIGSASVAFGGNANGDLSFTSGSHTNADASFSAVFGAYNVGTGDAVNWVSTDPLFEIGNGDGNVNSPVSDAIMVLKNGNTGINTGTSKPSYSIQVGKSAVTGIVARFQNSSGTCDINPTSASLSCSSDMNLKKNIINISDQSPWAFNSNVTFNNQSILNKILLLNPVEYNWNTESDNTTKHAGFIAQDVRQIFPDLVSEDPATHLLSLNYIGLVPYTVEAIKEMNVNIISINDLTKTNTWRDALLGWFGDLNNGIQSFFSHKVTTDQLCVRDDAGETCLTRGQVNQLLQASGGQAIVVTPTSVPSDTQSPAVSEPVVIAPVGQQTQLVQSPEVVPIVDTSTAATL